MTVCALAHYSFDCVLCCLLQHTQLNPAQIRVLCKSIGGDMVDKNRTSVYQSFRKSWSAGGTSHQALDHFDMVRTKVSAPLNALECLLQGLWAD